MPGKNLLSKVSLSGMKYNLLLIACIAVFQFNVKAQNTNSIYSAYGIGDLSVRDWNAYSPMGGLGIALKSDRTLNNLNPASYGGLQNNRYILEAAVTGTSIHYLTKDDNISGNDFNFKRAAFGMNLFKNLGTVIGLRQFSKVNYESVTEREVAGTGASYSESIKGNGGLHLFYLGNGYNITKNLSIGVTTGFLFGSVDKKETVSLGSEGDINIDNNAFYNKIYLNTGLQWQFKTGKYRWLLGATFQPAMQLRKEEATEITDASENVLKAATTINSKFDYPMQVGAGITLTKGHSRFGVDYIRQNWSSTSYKGTSFTTTDLQNFAVGYSYTFLKDTYLGKMERASIMAGFQRELSYLVVNNQQVTSMAGSLGVNIPSKNGKFNYTVGVRAGQRGEVSYPLVKEKFVDFTFNISLSDIFYIGGRKYD